MYLTIRQIDLVAYLLNCGQWRTSEQLSETFGLNKKTIQSEIKCICDLLDAECEIDVHPRKGYRLAELTENGRQKLRDTIRFYGDTRNSVGVRPSSLVLYLLFQDDYVSMQHLADGFFLSKTTVASEMETVRRWIARRTDLTLDISSVRGIRLEGNELRKRMYCVNHATRTAFGSLPFSPEIKEKYVNYLDGCREIIQKLMVVHKYLLTGESMFQISRFIAISLLRTQMGYLLPTDIVEPEDIPPLVCDTASQLGQKLGITLRQTEQQSVSALLKTCDRISNGLSFSDKTPVIPGILSEQLNLFEERLCQLLNVPFQPLFQDRKQVLQHVYNMILRRRNNQVAVNHYNEEIIRQYPLAVHLTHRLLPECFGLDISKETSFFSLLVQSAIHKLKREISVLLISNQNMPVAQQIEGWLRTKGEIPIGDFHVLPAYAYELQPQIKEEYDILLTTQKETLILHPEVYLIPPIMTQDEMDQLNFFIKALLEERRIHMQNSLREKYMQEQTIDEPNTDLYALLGCQDDGTLSYHAYSSVYLHVARLAPDIDTGIRIFHLSKPITFRHKRVKELIFTQFCQGEDFIFDFDQTVSDILHNQE